MPSAHSVRSTCSRVGLSEIDPGRRCFKTKLLQLPCLDLCVGLPIIHIFDLSDVFFVPFNKFNVHRFVHVKSRFLLVGWSICSQRGGFVCPTMDGLSESELAWLQSGVVDHRQPQIQVVLPSHPRDQSDDLNRMDVRLNVLRRSQPNQCQLRSSANPNQTNVALR